MKYRKFNKYEKKVIQSEAMKNAMHGEGMYLYENNSDATLTLPRPTSSGLRQVGPRSQFQGDSYYKQMVRAGHLRLIKTLQAPKPKEETMNEQKLILDQPDTVTEKGKVEHVVENTPVGPLHEQGGDEQPEVLLNEGPIDDGFVIVGN